MSQSNSPLDHPTIKEQIERWIHAGCTNATIVERLRGPAFNVPTSEAAIRRFRRRHGLNVPGVERSGTTVKGDEATATEAPQTDPPVLDDPDAMLKARGLDPLEWYVDAVTVNEWDGPSSDGNKVTYYQAKFTAKRTRPVHVIQPASLRDWVGQDRPVIGPHQRQYFESEGINVLTPKLVVIVGDQQAPFYDEKLDLLFRAWLQENQPAEGVLLGDTADFPDISRHPFDPESNATVNQCIQSAVDLLVGYVDASPDTRWTKLVGNHDARLRDYVLQQARELYKVARGRLPGEEEQPPLLSLDNVLRLPELGIELIDPHGPWDHGQHSLSPYLAVRHTWPRKKSGSATLDEFNYSVVVGHTHSQSFTEKTRYDMNGMNPTVLAAVEAGCMCSVERIERDGRWWPNFVTRPNWQQGFATATIWNDGKFKVDLAQYVNGVLLYRDQRFE